MKHTGQNLILHNLTRRPMAVHCNSGKTLHLPPGYVHEIPEEELKGNASVKKLESQKLLSVEPAKVNKAHDAKEIEV